MWLALDERPGPAHHLALEGCVERARDGVLAAEMRTRVMWRASTWTICPAVARDLRVLDQGRRAVVRAPPASSSDWRRRGSAARAARAVVREASGDPSRRSSPLKRRPLVELGRGCDLLVRLGGRHRRRHAPGRRSRRSRSTVPGERPCGRWRGYGVLVIDDQTIEQAVTRLSQAAGEGARVVLFGSHGRGDADHNSDLDFLVIQHEVEDRAAEAVRLRRALRGILAPIDIIVVSQDQVDEWGAVRGTVIEAALSEGRVVNG